MRMRKTSLRSFTTVKERRGYIQTAKELRLDAIGVYPTGLEEAKSRNCENMIGATSVPLGIAGPLVIAGEHAKGRYFLPLATTEAALVASVNRGCKAIALSGGANVTTVYTGITRGCLFKTKGIRESFLLKNWLETHMPELSTASAKTSSHLKLLGIRVKIVGKNVYVRFSYDTQDAMGMNMVTMATDAAAQFIKGKTGCSLISIAANFDIDKKPAFLNFILGRGREVWAEAVLEKSVVHEVLKTTPEKMDQVAREKCLLGSAVSGSLGYNAQYANVIAALFIATGQDAAHTVEGSLGITTTEITDSKLYISVYLPSVILGTVGGGTSLPSQKEALSILGIAGGGGGKHAAAFAEIVAGAVLAGEISLLASLAADTLASSHCRLARGEKGCK